MRRLIHHLSYANIVATLALFAALGTGGAYAATQLSKNSVGSKQLRKNAVTGGKVRNGSLGTGDLSKKAVKRLRGATGAAGPAGPAGAQGPAAVALFAIADNSGVQQGGNAQRIDPAGGGLYRVTFPRDVSQCAYTATVATVPLSDGTVVSPPSGGSAAVERGGGPVVVVRTFTASGSQTPSGFHLIVGC